MTWLVSIAVLLAGQLAELWVDWLVMRMVGTPVKVWQRSALTAGLQKLAIYAPLILTVWWYRSMYDACAAAGMQGLAMAAWKYWKLRAAKA